VIKKGGLNRQVKRTTKASFQQVEEDLGKRRLFFLSAENRKKEGSGPKRAILN